MIRRALSLSAASKYTQFLLALVSNVVVARLLTPGEIGIYAVAAVLAGIAQLFRDMGIGQYLTREPELTEEKIRTAFTLMVGSAWILGTSLALAADPVASFYGEPQLSHVLRVQTIAFFIIPFGAISLTLLKRDFLFGRTYFVDIAANLVQLTVTIWLAATGWGPQSLAWGSVGGVLTTAIGAVAARRGKFVYSPSLRGARAIIGFGATVTATQVLGTLNRDIPELLIGKLMGTPALAYFSKGLLPTSMFSRFVMGALNPVLLPAFSKKHRENDVERPLLHGMACLTAAMIPSFVLLACLSDWVVMLLFGSQWGAVVEPMRLFALATAVWSLTALISPALVALGHPRAPLLVQSVTVPTRIALVVLAIPYGLEAVAAAWLATACLSATLSFWNLRRLTAVRLLEVWRTVRPAVTMGCPVALFIGGAVLYLRPPVTTPVAALVVSVSVVLFAVAWYAALLVLQHPIHQEVRRFITRSRSGPAVGHET